MTGVTGRPLPEALAAKRGAIVEEWLARTLQSYPEHTSTFLSREKDPFKNPVGHTLAEALPALFDRLVEGADAATLSRSLDPIVRMRAVQDFSAGQAVAFIFLLKRVLREALGGEKRGGAGSEGLAALEARIDEMALLAFDLFMQCRERLYEIRAKEAKRRLFVLDRIREKRPGAG
jgi:hypothetical protein